MSGRNEALPKWSPRDQRVNIPNVPSIIPPHLKAPVLHAVLLRAQLEEIQHRLANLYSEAQSVVQFDSALPKQDTTKFDEKGWRIDQNPIHARDSLFQDRKLLIHSIDSIYPAFRVPGAFRIGYTKCTRKFFIPSPHFIGLILGPRGQSLKQLEAKCGVKISIRGQGSTPDAKGTGEVCTPRNPDEPLHALIESETETSIDQAIKELERIVMPIPDNENELKKAQLRQLAMYNGVISAESAFADPTPKDSTQPPWYDETLQMEGGGEVEDAVEKLLNDIDKKNTSAAEEEKEKRAERFKPFLINLRENDISMILPERLPPGTE